VASGVAAAKSRTCPRHLNPPRREGVRRLGDVGGRARQPCGFHARDESGRLFVGRGVETLRAEGLVDLLLQPLLELTKRRVGRDGGGGERLDVVCQRGGRRDRYPVRAGPCRRRGWRRLGGQCLGQGVGDGRDGGDRHTRRGVAAG